MRPKLNLTKEPQRTAHVAVPVEVSQNHFDSNDSCCPCFFLFMLILPASEQLTATHLLMSIGKAVFCVSYLQCHGHTFGLSDAQLGSVRLEIALLLEVILFITFLFFYPIIL
jgi:hypothetical protein